MGVLTIIFTLILLISPAVFFLVAATSQIGWWQGEIDHLNIAWFKGDSGKDHLKTVTLVTGITLMTIGVLIIGSVVLSSASSSAVAPTRSPSGRKGVSNKARRLYKGKRGGKFVRVKKGGVYVRRYI